MAKDLNIDYARIVRTAIMHTVDNGRKFNSHGSMLSMRSPSRAQIIKEIDPVVAGEGGRLSFDGTSGSPVAKVLMQWRPQRAAANLSSTRQNKSTVVAGANTEAGVLTDTIIYDQHNEYAEKFTQVQMMKLEPAAEAYLNAVNKGLTINNKNNAAWQGLAEIGERIMETIDNSIFDPLNLLCTTRLIAGMGKNLADGSTPLNLATVALFDAQSRPKPDLLQYIEQVRLKHSLKGRLIIVGGALIGKWMFAMKLSSVQDYGYNAEKMLANSNFEFFYDSNIDTNYGPGKIIIQDAGAAALGFVKEHTDVIKATKVGDTTYTSASMSMTGMDTEQTTIDMDLRIIESDAGAYPEIVVVPSVRAGIYTRPEGVIKTYGGFQDYTGIMGLQLVEFEDQV